MNDRGNRRNLHDFTASVVKRLKARRVALGLTCEDLGRRAAVGHVYITMLENGHIEPTLYTLARIKSVLDEIDGVSPKTIVELRELQRQIAIWRARLETGRERIKRAEGPLRAGEG